MFENYSEILYYNLVKNLLCFTFSDFFYSYENKIY